jgi:hypothetical protein
LEIGHEGCVDDFYFRLEYGLSPVKTRTHDLKIEITLVAAVLIQKFWK